MPRKTLGDFVAAAIAAGLDPATPAVAVASATRPDQLHVAAPLGQLAAHTETLPVGAPVLVILGQVAREEVAATTPFAKAAE